MKVKIKITLVTADNLLLLRLNDCKWVAIQILFTVYNTLATDLVAHTVIWLFQSSTQPNLVNVHIR